MIIQKLHIEREVDLDILADTLRLMFAGRPPVGRDAGIALVVGAVTKVVGCERPTAQQLVQALVFRWQLVLYRDTNGRELWRFRGPPARC